MLFEIIVFLAFLSDCDNVNSHSGIYDAAGNLRQGLKLVQGEWNILKMGNPKYIGQCKLVRFKTIYIESLDTAASIPLMADGIINDDMDTMVDYVSSKLTSYRSFSHDAILIFGFTMKQSDNGAVKARMSIKDGLSEWESWSGCSTTCGEGIQTRSRTCAYDAENFSQSLNEQRSCVIPATNWESWSSCSTTCDSGTQTRTRTCAYNQATSTHESKTDQRTCNIQNCCGDWGSWGDCSKTCGEGTQTKTKTCFAGIMTESIGCISPATDWGSWSDCSQTCDNGMQTRTRTCAYNQGSFSHESKTEEKSCYIQECCDTTWTSWSEVDAVCSNHGKGPFKKQESRQRYTKAACSNSVETETRLIDCDEYGDWGSGNYCGADLANMIIKSKNGCRRHNGSEGGHCTLREEAEEYIDGDTEAGNINEEAQGACEVYFECCYNEGKYRNCSPNELGSEEC